MTKRDDEPDTGAHGQFPHTRRGRRLLLTFVAIGIALLGITAACGSERPDAAGGGALVGSGDVRSGPCAVDGAKHACHVETSRDQTVVNCFSGAQLCEGGVWGPCGGREGTLTTLSLPHVVLGGGVSIRAVVASDASTNGGGCATNPCNPNCWGIDVDAGKLQTLAITSTAIQGTVKSVSDFPGGAGGPKNSMGNKNATYIAGPPDRIRCTIEPPYPAATYLHCSSDFCCASHTVGSNTATCQPWAVVDGENPIALSKCNRAPGPDFTIGLACNDTTVTPSSTRVPVCNRGAGATTGGTLMVAEYSGNPKYSGDTDVCTNPGSPSAFCLINLTTRPIASGKCIDLDVNRSVAGSVPGVTCSSVFSSGNRTMMVNPPATAGYTQLAEGDPCNNYGFHATTSQGGTCAAYGTQPPPPVATSYTYTAICPGGSKSVWNQLAYNTTVPDASDVRFSVSTASRLLDGGTGTFTVPVIAARPATPLIVDPAICPMSGPAPCPKNLSTILGATAASNEVLKLDLVLTATSAVPTVNSWQFTYNCIPNE